MAHFAQINENNAVLQVIVVNNNDILDENGNESEQKGVEFCQALFPNTTWKQTSYNAKFRKNYAGIGYSYDPARDAFVPPKFFASWVLNEETCRWEPPTPRPQDGNLYEWDENSLSWIQVSGDGNFIVPSVDTVSLADSASGSGQPAA